MDNVQVRFNLAQGRIRDVRMDEQGQFRFDLRPRASRPYGGRTRKVPLPSFPEHWQKPKLVDAGICFLKHADVA